MEKIRIGVIGAGVLGAFHIEKCLKNSDISLIGFHDVNESRARFISASFSVQSYPNLHSLLANIDAAIVAVPASAHAMIVEQCLEAKKHVLVEKPLASSYKEATSLVAKAAAVNCVLHVGHSEAFNDAFERLLQMKPKPLFVEIHRLAPFSSRGTDVSVVLDLMVHDIQLLFRLCNEEPLYDSIIATGVSVVSSDIDIANVRFRFPSGCIANVTASRISNKKMRKLRLFQKDNYFSVDLGTGQFEHYYVVHESEGKGQYPIAYKCEKIPQKDSLEKEHCSFIEAIRYPGTITGVSGEEGALVIRATDKILELLREIKT